MCKSSEDTEEDKEEMTLDEKSPSVTSLNDHTLFRQKSRSGSEKDQQDEEKQIEEVRNSCYTIIAYIYQLIHQFNSF